MARAQGPGGVWDRPPRRALPRVVLQAGCRALSLVKGREGPRLLRCWVRTASTLHLGWQRGQVWGSRRHFSMGGKVLRRKPPAFSNHWKALPTGWDRVCEGFAGKAAAKARCRARGSVPQSVGPGVAVCVCVWGAWPSSRRGHLRFSTGDRAQARAAGRGGWCLWLLSVTFPAPTTSFLFLLAAGWAGGFPLPSAGRWAAISLCWGLSARTLPLPPPCPRLVPCREQVAVSRRPPAGFPGSLPPSPDGLPASVPGVCSGCMCRHVRVQVPVATGIDQVGWKQPGFA